jgi:hypothetical protein
MYISTLVVIPWRSISALANRMAARTSSAVSRPSRGHMTSLSQRFSGSPSPIPRNSVMGEWQCAFSRPGLISPGSRVSGAFDGGASATGPIQVMRPSATSSTASRSTVPARSPSTTAPARYRLAVTSSGRVMGGRHGRSG